MGQCARILHRAFRPSVVLLLSKREPLSNSLARLSRRLSILASCGHACTEVRGLPDRPMLETRASTWTWSVERDVGASSTCLCSGRQVTTSLRMCSRAYAAVGTLGGRCYDRCLRCAGLSLCNIVWYMCWPCRVPEGGAAAARELTAHAHARTGSAQPTVCAMFGAGRDARLSGSRSQS